MDDFLDLSHIVDDVVELLDAGDGEGSNAKCGGSDTERVHLE